MKKLCVLPVIAMIIIMPVLDCFAQSNEVQTMALQGEWLITRIQIGHEITILSEPPFSDMMEMSFVFEGNNYQQQRKIPNFGIIEITERGVFRIVSDEMIIIRDDGVNQSFFYNIQEGNLTMRMTIEDIEIIMTSRKR